MNLLKRIVFFSSFALFAAENPVAGFWWDSKEKESEEAAIPCCTIQRIRVVDSEEKAQAPYVGSDWIEIDIPCDARQLRYVLTPFLCQRVGSTTIREIKHAVKKTLTDDFGLPVSVSVPEQILYVNADTQVSISVVAKPPVLGKIKVEGNRWFKEKALCNAMRLTHGQPVWKMDLLNAAAWVNANPFIHTDTIVRKGNEPGSMDIDLVVQDRFPVRMYAGTDNTGTSFTGNNRLFTGFNASLGLRTLLAYQFTASYDFPEFLSHYGNFTWFLPWKHEFVLFGAYSTVHPTIADFESSGVDIQFSMRYIVPLKPLYLSFKQQLKWGADYKQTNSDLFFVGGLPSSLRIAVSQKRADLFQLYLGYKGSVSKGLGSGSFAGELYASPFIFLPHQTTADYNSLRPGAQMRYVYAKGALGMEYSLRRCKVSGFFRGQLSSGALLPSEQYGLGGYDTVRGYQERVFLADNAAIVNLELHSPTLSFFKLDKLYFLGFFDGAYGRNWHATDAFPKDAVLIGIGPGIRYSINPYLTTRFDYGFRIHNTSFGNGQIGRFHFSVIAGY